MDIITIFVVIAIIIVICIIVSLRADTPKSVAPDQASRLNQNNKQEFINNTSSLVQNKDSAYKKNDIPKDANLSNFLNLCKQSNFNSSVRLTITCRVNKRTSAISTFAVRLFPVDKKLEDLTIAPSDKNADCWFDDAISLSDLGVDSQCIDSFKSFSTSAENKGTALRTLIAFDKFMKEIEDSKIGVTIISSNTNTVFTWVCMTFIASQTIPTSQFLLGSVSDLMSRIK